MVQCILILTLISLIIGTRTQSSAVGEANFQNSTESCIRWGSLVSTLLRRSSPEEPPGQIGGSIVELAPYTGFYFLLPKKRRLYLFLNIFAKSWLLIAFYQLCLIQEKLRWKLILFSRINDQFGESGMQEKKERRDGDFHDWRKEPETPAMTCTLSEQCLHWKRSS